MSILEMAKLYEQRAFREANVYKQASLVNAQFGKQYAQIANMLVIARELRILAKEIDNA